MNAFLHVCCFIPPEDDSLPNTPSFLEHFSRPISSSSKSSDEINHYRKAIKFEGGVKNTSSEDVVYIKRYSANEQSNFKNRKNLNNKPRVSCRNPYCCDNQLLVVLPEDNCVYQGSSRNSHGYSTETSSYVSVYGPKTARLPPHSKARLLDALSNCLWKCSLGCQQLPTINV